MFSDLILDRTRSECKVGPCRHLMNKAACLKLAARQAEHSRALHALPWTCTHMHSLGRVLRLTYLDNT